MKILQWVPVSLLLPPILGSQVLAQEKFLRGDLNGDGEVTLADVLILAGSIANRSALPCPDAADINDNGLVNLGDAALLIEFLLNGWTAPAAPFPDRGPDPTEDSLGCGDVPVREPFDDPGSGYSLSVTPSGSNLRLRVSMENPVEAIGGRLVFAFPAGWADGAKVMDVKTSLELSAALKDDHVVMGEMGKDGKLRIVWLLSIAGTARTIKPGASRQLFDIILCPGTTPAGDYAVDAEGPGELLTVDGGRVLAGVKGATAKVAQAGAACLDPPWSPDTVRPYIWMGDVEVRYGAGRWMSG